jgi:hypothetical protein
MSQILIAMAFSFLFGFSDSMVFGNGPLQERELLRFEEARESPSFDGEDVPVEPSPQRVICGRFHRDPSPANVLAGTIQTIQDFSLLSADKEISLQRSFSQKDLYQRQEVYRL